MSNVLAGWLLYGGLLGLIVTLALINELLMIRTHNRKKDKENV